MFKGREDLIAIIEAECAEEIAYFGFDVPRA